VVDDGALIGVVTDRDLFIALATQNERAASVRIGAVATMTVAACAPDDDLQDALAIMRHVRVRRLPVVGFGTSLLGILSMNDIVMAIAKSDDVSCEDVVQTLTRITATRGKPKTIKSDNGSEFISKAMDKWAYERGVELDFSRPGKPTDNARVESFNGRLRQECLNANWFLSLDDAKAKIDAWSGAGSFYF